METRRSERGSEDNEILLFLQPYFEWALSSINIETMEITVAHPLDPDNTIVLANRTAYLWLSYRRRISRM